jgi:hypothetical protein
MYQDHEAHISVHMAAMEDPKLQQIIGQSPFAGAIKAAAMAHITEHVAMQYRKEIEKRLGIPLPAEGEPMPEDIEVELSRVTAQAAQKLLSENQNAQAQQEAQQQAQDPLTQIQLKELAIKEQEVRGKQELERMRLELSAMRDAENIAVQRERIRSEDRREGARIGVRVATQIDDASRTDKKDGVRLGMEIAKGLAIGTTAVGGGES